MAENVPWALVIRPTSMQTNHIPLETRVILLEGIRPTFMTMGWPIEIRACPTARQPIISLPLMTWYTMSYPLIQRPAMAILNKIQISVAGRNLHIPQRSLSLRIIHRIEARKQEARAGPLSVQLPEIIFILHNILSFNLIGRRRMERQAFRRPRSSMRIHCEE